MASRNGAMTLGILLAGLIIFGASGGMTGPLEARTELPDTSTPSQAQKKETRSPELYPVIRHAQTDNVRDGQFDRGVWCAYKKVAVYDKYHDENYFIDKKVCLGTVAR